MRSEKWLRLHSLRGITAIQNGQQKTGNRFYLIVFLFTVFVSLSNNFVGLTVDFPQETYIFGFKSDRPFQIYIHYSTSAEKLQGRVLKF